MTPLEEAIAMLRAESEKSNGAIFVADFNGHRIGSNMTDEEIYRTVFTEKELYDISLDTYQAKAMTTCMASCDNFSYMMLNLVGEVGEFASKVAKKIRKQEAYINGDELCINGIRMKAAEEANLRKEAGDVLWQLAGLCHAMGWKLSDVAQENLAKLASRKERHVIDGDGDNR